jgi:hypothetical protein
MQVLCRRRALTLPSPEGRGFCRCGPLSHRERVGVLAKVQGVCRRGALTLPSPAGRGFRRCGGGSVLFRLVLLLLERDVAGDSLPARHISFGLPGLERLEAAVEGAGNGQRLVRGDLARRHGQHRRVEHRDDVAGPGRLGNVELDRPAARRRHEMAEDEARRHRVAGLRLVDEDAADDPLLAVRDELAQPRRAVTRARPLPIGIAGLAGEKAAGGVAPGCGD